jgi:hypothetical protein
MGENPQVDLSRGGFETLPTQADVATDPKIMAEF